MKTIIALLFAFITWNSNAQHADSPKLVVGIVVDQMCYEYLYRYYERFGEGGFKKLMNRGTNCRNVRYNYIPTYTWNPDMRPFTRERRLQIMELSRTIGIAEKKARK